MTSATVRTPHVHHILHTRFGHRDFRPGQETIIHAVLQGHNTLVVMPTGSGKSLCYQLPALLRDGCTIVISPLIALMKDQVDSLQAQGIAATFVNSSLAVSEQRTRLQACRDGAYDLLYVAPERFRNARFMQAMSATRVGLFAVDEAHCISAWGHDFRPDYLRLRQAIETLHRPQVLALTATATVDVQQDIVAQLGCDDMQRFVTGFNRPNLTYRVLGVNALAAKLCLLSDLLSAQEDGSAIVYAATRRAVEEIAAFLHDRGLEVLLYHAGLSDGVRRRTQDAFMVGTQRVIVATNAFGMGVDKPDVRSVVHFNVPRTMEAYYQEAGRAGRDGRAAQCILLFSHGDVRIQEFLLEQSYPSRQLLEEIYGLVVSLSRRQSEVSLRSLLPHRHPGSSLMQVDSCLKILERAGYIERLAEYDSGDDAITQVIIRLAQDAVAPQQLQLDYAALQRRKRHELQKMRQMVGYANTRQCRRQRILHYFGELWEQPNCAACDACLQDGAFAGTSQYPPRVLTEGEWLTVQKILSCVARMRGRYGKVRVIQVLMGSRAKEIRETHLARLSTYGILRGTARPVIEAYIDALLAADCVQIVGDEFPKLDLTSQGWAVMRRKHTIQLALPGAVPTPEMPSLCPTPVVDAAGVPLPEPDAALVERLRAQRTALARAESVPPYCVFHDRTLHDMAVHLPTTRAELLAIRGVGHVKADKYGAIFLDLLRGHTGKREA